MLNRNDLAKQFELVVKQEIKNHNDQMLATNLSINEMKSSIADIWQEIQKMTAALVSKIKELDFHREMLTCTLSDVKHKSESFINDQRFENSSNLITKELNTKHLDEINQKLDNLYQCSKNSTKEMMGLLSNFSLLQIQRQSDLQDFKNILNQKLQDLKIEILSLPSEAQEVKKDIESKISIDRVDFAGVTRELQIVKKYSYIQEKKIENLYTLIERLKAGST